MKVYLAGPINGKADDECNGWRSHAKSYLSRHAVCIDPMSRDYRGKESNETADEIVNGDIADIRKCDVVLANCEGASYGTAMEIAYSYMMHVPVVTWGSNSPWVLYHSTRFQSFQDALDYIRGEFHRDYSAELLTTTRGNK